MRMAPECGVKRVQTPKGWRLVPVKQRAAGLQPQMRKDSTTDGQRTKSEGPKSEIRMNPKSEMRSVLADTAP